jgi:hypothetical protein
MSVASKEWGEKKFAQTFQHDCWMNLIFWKKTVTVDDSDTYIFHDNPETKCQWECLEPPIRRTEKCLLKLKDKTSLICFFWYQSNYPVWICSSKTVNPLNFKEYFGTFMTPHSYKRTKSLASKIGSTWRKCTFLHSTFSKMIFGQEANNNVETSNAIA